MKDEELILDIYKGNHEAFKSLFFKYYESLCNYSFNFLKNWQDVEEVVQDVFLKIWENRREMKINQSVKYYLFRAAHNQSINYLNKEKFAIRYKTFLKHKLENIEKAESSYHDPFFVEKMEFALDQLPPRCKEVFELSRFGNLKYFEIAEKLNISPKTVEVHISKALKILRKELHYYID